MASAFTSGTPLPVVVINWAVPTTTTLGKVDQGAAGAAAWKVDASGSPAAPVTGTVTANQGGAPWSMTVSSLPLPAGASTAAKQPALGTAGTASADVLSVQGIASMTPLKVDPSAVTSPVLVASPGNMATGQVSVGNTPTLIAASRAGRLGITIENLGVVDIFIGNSGVSITTGMLLSGVKGAAMSLLFNGAIYGIVSAGTQSVSVLEVF